MSNAKYQIFVSSTFKDLEQERRVVIEQILNLGHIPVGMELFQAADETQWNYIKRRIDECDYYTVIVAERYGSEHKNKSYTQMEYEYAVKAKIPTVSFLLHPDARENWPAKNIEFSKADKVNAFRKLCQKKLVKFWKNSDDLGSKFATSMIELIRARPRTGWIRADAVAASTALNEITRLSEEKRVLQESLLAEGWKKINSSAVYDIEFSISQGEILLSDMQKSLDHKVKSKFHINDALKWADKSAKLIASINPAILNPDDYSEDDLIFKDDLDLYGTLSEVLLFLKTLRTVGHVWSKD